jgi:hypothetical protein
MSREVIVGNKFLFFNNHVNADDHGAVTCRFIALRLLLDAATYSIDLMSLWHNDCNSHRKVVPLN